MSLSEQELGRLMRTLGPRLLALARGICRDSSLAEDVVQEAFVKLWRTPPDGPEQVVPSWLRRVVVNSSINILRRRKREAALGVRGEMAAGLAGEAEHGSAAASSPGKPGAMCYDPPDTRMLPEERLDLDDTMQRVERALERLPADKRAILVMKVYEGMSYEEIAVTLEVPIGTVMSRLNRARLALRDLIEEDLKQPEADPLVFPLRRRA